MGSLSRSSLFLSHECVLHTNPSPDHLLFWNTSSVNHKIPYVAFHFKEQQVLCAGAVTAAESRIRNRHFSSSFPGDSPVSPCLLLDIRTACTRHILHSLLKAIIIPCDEISQKMKESNTLTCCHLLFVCTFPFIPQRVSSLPPPSSCRKHRCVLNTLSHSLDTLALFLNTLQCNIFRSLHFPDYLKTFRSLCLQGRAEGGALRESRSFCLLPVVVLEEIFSPGLIMSLLPFH